MKIIISEFQYQTILESNFEKNKKLLNRMLDDDMSISEIKDTIGLSLEQIYLLISDREMTIDCEDELSSIIGEITFEDVSFFLGVILENPDFMETPIVRPELKKYKINHIYQTNVLLNQIYSTKMNSYIPLSNTILYDLQTIGLYEPTDSPIFDEEEVESDYVDDWINDIREIKN